MQKLVFEKAWERTINEWDRQWIIDRFEQTKDQPDIFVPLKNARNHRNDLLVTVLIHNPALEPLDLRTVTLQLLEEKKEVTKHTFNETRLFLEPQTSMPWTFIFPESLLPTNLTEESIYLLIHRQEEK